jgi:hypothetical protein
MFKPNVQQFTTPIRIQHRTIINVSGDDEIDYNSESHISYCNWKSMGGTENVESGVRAVYDTATIIMWFDPSISEYDRVLLNDDETLVYSIENVENVEKRNMFLILKVKRVVSVQAR